MTLATILSLCIAYSAPASLVGDWLPLAGQTPQNQASQNQTPQNQASQNQASQNQAGGAGQSGNAGTDAQTQPPPASQGQTPSPAATTTGQKPATSKHGSHKKKATASAPVDCPPATSSSSPASADAASASTSPNASPSNQPPSSQVPSNPAPSNSSPNQVPPNKSASNPAPSGNASAPVNCPPSKTVVREGGTTEPAIQLVGGKGAEQASQQRSTTDQLLESTEDNLKKVAGRQLSSSQQEMVNQIQQFIQQSKAAVSAGDVERGRNLAKKANLLSDELVKP